MDTGKEAMFCAGLMVCLSGRLLKKSGADFRANITKRSTWFSEVVLKPAAGFTESYFWAVRGRPMRCSAKSHSKVYVFIAWHDLSSVHTIPVSTGRVHGPCWIHWWPTRPVNTGVSVFTKSRAVSTGVQNDARVHGHVRHCAHPWTWPVDTGNVYRDYCWLSFDIFIPLRKSILHLTFLRFTPVQSFDVFRPAFSGFMFFRRSPMSVW